MSCQSTVTAPSASCAKLIPISWREPVEGAAIPNGDVQEWQAGFVAQSVQLSKANGRTADAIAIVEGCEALVNDVRKPKQFLGVF